MARRIRSLLLGQRPPEDARERKVILDQEVFDARVRLKLAPESEELRERYRALVEERRKQPASVAKAR